MEKKELGNLLNVRELGRAGAKISSDGATEKNLEEEGPC